MSAPSDNLPPDQPPGPPPLGETVRDQAVAWHVRLSSDDADGDDWLAFEAWLADSPEHLAAYEAVEQVWSDLDQVTLAPTVVTLKPRVARRPLPWLGAIAASLIAVIFLGTMLWTGMPRTQTLETAAGQRQVFALADGSHITLNGGSRLTARMGRSERRVVMADAGEAVFDVAKDPGRPFLIEAGDREIRVVGTEFNVLRHGGVVRVTVRRGVVEVRPAGTPQAQPIARLRAGQALSHRAGGVEDVVTAADPDAVLAWTEGRLVFRGEPLGEVVATLNRYVKTPITVAPDAAGLPVTATLAVGGEDAMLQSLSAFLPVQADRLPDSVRLSLRRQAR